jgi:hypothetical protein
VRAEVEVIMRQGFKYVQTHRDGVPTDNLLALDQCDRVKFTWA